MSRISDLLQQIMDAVYGKDVRGAIHDSIAECYTNTSTGKTLAETAAEEANTAAANANAAAARIPSDYTELLDDVDGLQNAIDKYGNPFESANEHYTSGIKRIVITDPSVANYKYYRIHSFRKNESHHLFLSLQGSDDMITWSSSFDSINVTYDAETVYPRVETLRSTNRKFYVIIDWHYVDTANLSITDLDALLKNDVVDRPLVDLQTSMNDNITALQTSQTSMNSAITALQTNEQMYNTPFSVAIPASDFAQMGGIVGVNIYKRGYITYKHYQLSRVTHNSTWYAYIQLKGTNADDNTGWTLIDSFEVRAADAPNPQPATEILYSKYNRASITIVWAQMANSFDLTNKDYRLKSTAIVDLPLTATQEKLAALEAAVDSDAQLNAFELADQVNRATNVVIVDASLAESGNGQYKTIGEAYAAITDSAFDNQYEIVVYPGTYEENNLKPPVYTHTHGVFPGQTIVDSTGIDDVTNSVFDQGHGPSKLSNMVIKSQTKYCVHQDDELIKSVLANENLTCIKLPGGNPENNACIGIGADFGGAKFIWRNCTFIDGPVDAHTNPNQDPNGNQHLIYENCMFVNAPLRLFVSGNPMGEFVCEVKNCKAMIGTGGITLKMGADITGVTKNFPWQLIGGGNNMPLRMYTSGNPSTETADLWDCVSVTEKIYVTAAESITKGQFVTIFGTVADNTTPLTAIAGQAVADASSGNYLPVWCGPIMYLVDNSDGEYGIDNGALSSSATIKVGRVYNKRFYPYYLPI